MPTAKAQFTVKETADGQPWVLIEYLGDCSGMPAGHLGLHLPDGSSLEDAKELAHILRTRVTEVVYHR